MKEYIAMLRGINVTGKNTIVMKDLQKMFEDLAFKSAATYIQSGNVTFCTEEKSAEKLSVMLEEAIMQSFGIDSPVIIRTRQQLKKIAENLPFETDKDSKIYFTLFRKPPPPKNLEELSGYGSKHVLIAVEKNHACILLRNGYKDAKLSNNFIEKKLGVSATTRNLRTIRHLAGLPRDID